MKKRILALLLVLSMLVSMVPTVFAADTVAKIGEQGYETLDAAFTAAQNGDEVKILEAGTYALSTSGKDITITGAVEGVVFDNIGAKNMVSANVTFNNVTFDYYPNVNYTGLQHSGNLTYNNCVFNGQVFLYGASETFVGCTFNQNSADAYNVWTYGAKKVAFKECAFNSAGKSVLVYNEGACATELTVVDSEFIASAPVEGKAAIEIDTALMPDGTSIAIDAETTATGFGTGSVSGNSLWNDKKNQEDLSITVGDKVVWPVYAAQIGETMYADLQEALDAAAASTGEVTVEILCDINMTGKTWNPVTVSAPGYPLVTVNGNDHTITGLSDMLFAGTWAGKSGLIINDLTIADSNIVHDKDDNEGTVGVGAFIGFPQASATITLNNCHLVKSSVEGGHWTGGLIGYAAGYAGNDGPVFMNLIITDCSVSDSAITGKGSVGGIIGHGSGNGWTNVVIEDTAVTGNKISSTGSSNNKAGSVMGTIGAAGQPTTADGETKTGGAFISAAVSDNTVTSNGTVITTIYGRQGSATGALTVTGGSYDTYPIEEDVAYAAPAEGFYIVMNNGSYSVTDDVDVLNFVVLGDSMTNGYGMDGYYPLDKEGEYETADQLDGDHENKYGYRVNAAGAWPSLVAEAFERSGELVNLQNLAISGMRPEELRAILDPSYTGDAYTQTVFLPADLNSEEPDSEQRLCRAIGCTCDRKDNNGCTNGYEVVHNDYVNYISDADVIAIHLGTNNFGTIVTNKLQRLMGIGDSEKYDNITWGDQIKNPEYKAVYDDVKPQITAALAQTMGNVGSEIIVSIADIMAYGVAGFFENYLASYEIIKELNPNATIVVVGVSNPLEGTSLTLADGKIIDASAAFEIVTDAINGFLAGNLGDDVYFADVEELDIMVNALGRDDINSVYAAKLVETIIELKELELQPAEQRALITYICGDDATRAYMKQNPDVAKFAAAYDAIVAGAADTNLSAETFVSMFTEGLSGDVLNDPDIIQVYARCMMAEGIGIHPSEKGHEQIAAAVLAAMENGYTGSDMAKDNAEEYAKKALWLITEYYDDVYAMVYDKLDEQGYVAASVAALEYAKAQIEAIDVDALDLSDEMKAELKEEAALAIEAIEALQTLLVTADELDDETVKAAQALLDDLTDALENMNDILAVAGTDLENAVNAQLAALDAAIRAQAAAAVKQAQAALETLEQYIDGELTPAVRAEIEELIATAEQQLAYLEAVINNQIEATKQDVLDAIAALQQAVAELKTAVETEADQLLQTLINELQALAQATAAQFEQAVYDATHISMSIYDEQYYVSLGGATANGAGVSRNDKIYSDLVVEALEAEGVDVTLVDRTKADLTYEGLVDYVAANADEIAKATLITWNMDASGFLTAILSSEDTDWSPYFNEAEIKAALKAVQAEIQALQTKLAAELDAEALAALAKAENDVLTALREQVDLETAEQIAPYVEKLLYAAVAYTVETAKAMEAINQINPDAEVVLVGMYNPLAGTSVTVNGETIDLGALAEYAMEATDLYHLVYAVASGNVTFVDVSETAVDGLGSLTVDDPKLLVSSLGSALFNAGARISANKAGHEYIAEQIIGAIDFVGMLGDINLDGVVDTADAVAAVDAWLEKIELNELQKNNGDVNFDGAVDAADAALIVDFWLEKIQSFEK